jgi:RNA-directed DNA polymerase
VGAVVSPLLANVYPDRLDREWQTRGCGTLVRYADDLVVMCGSERDARRALQALRACLAELGLRPKQAKTRIVHLREGGEGVDFLGFHHRWVRANRAKHVQFLARWPSRRAMQHARDRVREITARERLLLPSRTSCRTSIGTCAAGRAISATATRPASST